MTEPKAVITMKNGGKITLELYPEKSPNTVANFIALANSGFYNNLIFHRVIPGFMIQGGCPFGIGMGDAGYSIKGEFSANGFSQNDISHMRGVISMARSQDANSASSQFFIMHEDSPQLDGMYAAFGKVIEGLDVVDEIADIETGRKDKPLVPQVIETVHVDTFGEQFPAPEKI
ncbi:MAG: peptidylprolyl isomerase [Clostridiales bacterium]|jgi:peptidyl-prolyl cis-trans isomerase B (cyclophilin B)|nr:peptidylprolyl isomerase [Clostridiales bacterium]